VPFTKAGETPIAGLGVGLSIAMWNYFGWDNASTVGGEVVDGGRTYPARSPSPCRWSPSATSSP
jgi:amino acid transporter